MVPLSIQHTPPPTATLVIVPLHRPPPPLPVVSVTFAAMSLSIVPEPDSPLTDCELPASSKVPAGASARLPEPMALAAPSVTVPLLMVVPPAKLSPVSPSVTEPEPSLVRLATPPMLPVPVKA